MSPYCCKNNSGKRWPWKVIVQFFFHIELLDLLFSIVESLKNKFLAYELACCPLMSCTDYNPVHRPLLILWFYWIVVDMFQNLIHFLIYQILMTRPQVYLTKILRWSWDWADIQELGQIWSKIIRFQNQNCSKVSMAESVSVTDQLELAIWNHGPGLQDLPMYEQLHCGLRVYLHRCQLLGKASMFASTPGRISLIYTYIILTKHQ